MGIFFLVSTEADKKVKVSVGAFCIGNPEINFIPDHNRCRGCPENKFVTVFQNYVHTSAEGNM